ncbi:MAG: SRPBCC domain-containing protein [Bacteroidota bacterium]
MKDSIKMKVTYDHSLESVWEALTDAEAMSEWLMPCDIKPIVGHQFQFRTKPYPGFDGIVNCEVLEVIEKELLSFSWNGGSLKETKVSFRLEKNGDGTTLQFEHSGFQGFFNKLVVKKILSNGWKTKILVKLLPKYLSK